MITKNVNNPCSDCVGASICKNYNVVNNTGVLTQLIEQLPAQFSINITCEDKAKLAYNIMRSQTKLTGEE